jgi:Domain of unknown function (DUF4347)
MSGLFGQADGAQFLSQAQTLQPGLELVFVDHDLATLLPELSWQHLRSTEIIQLDAQTDGFAQVTNILAQRKNITAIHLLSHGSAGQIQLGNTTLTQENLNQYQPQISHWRSALNAGADILIYGCDVASNSAGINLIHNLQKLTQADINASIDVTGNSARRSPPIPSPLAGLVKFSHNIQKNIPSSPRAMTVSDYQSTVHKLSMAGKTNPPPNTAAKSPSSLDKNTTFNSNISKMGGAPSLNSLGQASVKLNKSFPKHNSLAAQSHHHLDLHHHHLDPRHHHLDLHHRHRIPQISIWAIAIF